MLPPQREHNFNKIAVFEKTPKKWAAGTCFGTQNRRKSTPGAAETNKFLDFWSPQRRFPTILGPKTGPGSLRFRCFFKNGDFVKIVLPLWWEHSFQGLDLPKIDLEIDCERQRRTTSKKIASDAVSERTFSVPGSFLVDFGVQLGSQDILFGPTFGRLS